MTSELGRYLQKLGAIWHDSLVYRIVALHQPAVVRRRSAVLGAGVGSYGLVEPSGDLAGGEQVFSQVARISSCIVWFRDKLLAVLASEPENMRCQK